MKRFIFICLVFVLFPFSQVWALGMDHIIGDNGKYVDYSPDWPSEFVDLVNSGGCVGGFWVNQNDWFFFRGDAKTFNEFLKAYGSLKNTPLQVIIHAGPEQPDRPWDGQPLSPYDWQLEILKRGWGVPKIPNKPEEQYVVTVNLWIDKQIKLSDVIVPNSIQLKSAEGSNKEIERFIAQRPSLTTNAPSLEQQELVQKQEHYPSYFPTGWVGDIRKLSLYRRAWPGNQELKSHFLRRP
jgi:hypothetical protein